MIQTTFVYAEVGMVAWSRGFVARVVNGVGFGHKV